MVRASLCLVAAAVLTGVNGERSVRQAGAKWVPKPGITWQWQLSAPIQTPGLIPVDTSFDVDVYDVDLFFTAQADIDKLKAKKHQGHMLFQCRDLGAMAVGLAWVSSAGVGAHTAAVGGGEIYGH
eukprot:comp20829_c0_seq1/m.27492 comp20829_c0_seq1/g.27492  ORF comp20829_c0_seq1/g.27492 comp20829_c0_seq1/m.27492 type:complete len:125 (-) comp20829_c0_seq1:748-1122(-)